MALRFYMGHIVDAVGSDAYRWHEVEVSYDDVMALTNEITKFQFPACPPMMAAVHGMKPAVWYTRDGEPQIATMLCDPILFEHRLALDGWQRTKNNYWYEYTKEE